MREEQTSSAVRLTKYLITLPSLKVLLTVFLSIPFMLFLCLTTLNILASHNLAQSYALSTYIIGFLFPSSLLLCILKLFFPNVPLRQCLALVIVTELIFAFAILGKHVVELFLPSIYGNAVLFVFGGISAGVMYLIARYVFGRRWISLIFAAVHLFLFSIFLWIAGIMPSSPHLILIKFLLSSALFFFFLFALIAIINAPMKKNFGIATMDAASVFLRHWVYEDMDVVDYLKNIATKVKVPVDFITFHTKKRPVVFVIPSIHFGPFSELGASALPYELKALFKKHGMDCVVLHGAATHDLDPANNISKVLFYELLKQISDTKPSSPTNISLASSQYGKAKANLVLFNGCGLCLLSRAPEVTEDINMAMGMVYSSLLEKMFNAQISICDAHNSGADVVKTFEPGSEEGHEYLMAVKKLGQEEIKKDDFLFGFAESSAKFKALGDAGISVVVFGKGPSVVLVIFDANGIENKLRTAIERKVRETLGLDEDALVEVVTTDTHSINKVRGVINALEYDKKLVEEVEKLVKEANEHKEKVKVSAGRFFFSYPALGPLQSAELISTVNSIMAMIKILIPVLLGWAILTLIYVLLTI